MNKHENKNKKKKYIERKIQPKTLLEWNIHCTFLATHGRCPSCGSHLSQFKIEYAESSISYLQCSNFSSDKKSFCSMTYKDLEDAEAFSHKIAWVRYMSNDTVKQTEVSYIESQSPSLGGGVGGERSPDESPSGSPKVEG